MALDGKGGQLQDAHAGAEVAAVHRDQRVGAERQRGVRRHLGYLAAACGEQAAEPRAGGEQRGGGQQQPGNQHAEHLVAAGQQQQASP
ncbi:hypothetical protein D3C80_1851700 [compost metagenome]